MADFDITTTDDTFTEATGAQKQTVLDSLKDELKRVIKNNPITLNVPTRPHISLVFDTNIEAGQLQLWRKACRDKSMPDEFDSLKFSCIIIANKCEQVIWDGKVATDENDQNLNFRNAAFLEMLDAPRATIGVRSLYGVDGHIFIATDAILRAAGYDSEGQEQDVDPTLLT